MGDIAPSPRLRVPPSPHLSIALSPCPRVFASPCRRIRVGSDSLIAFHKRKREWAAPAPAKNNLSIESRARSDVSRGAGAC